MVVGCSGAGKSTFAITLGNLTGLPVTHLDKIHWLPGWVERDKQEKSQLIAMAEAQRKWIIEGNYSATFPSRTSRSDTIIWLDLPLSVRLARIVKRHFHYRNKTRPDMPENCPERLERQYLKWVLFKANQHREKIAQAIADAPHLKVHHIRTAKGADTLLEWLADEHQTYN